MAQRIRTLVIEDSAFMLKVITDIICSDAEIDLIGTASNGKDGTDLALKLMPDVVITDMMMPEYDGMYVVRSVMDQRPVPIILLSSLEKTSSRIFDALQYGAFEFIDKPTDLNSASIRTYPLLPLIKEASRTDISLLKARQLEKQSANAHTFSDQLNYEIIALGASTGGPGALETIITSLPKNLNVPVVIAQHMPSRFLETFAVRLNEHSPLPVKLAQKGEMLKPGLIYIAPGESNTCIELNALHSKPAITFTTNTFQEFNNPSIDCLFESIARTYGEKSMAVVLTGMGKDGTKGLSEIRKKGGLTIAQDEYSSVVFGMPKAAVDANAVSKVLPLKEIAGFIICHL